MEHGTHSMYVHDKCRCELCREAESAYQAEYRRLNLERLRAYDRTARRDSRLRDDPQKRKVRWDAWYATKGQAQPCEACGREDAQRHHDDYAKPLEVRWLCPPCHAKEHRAKYLATVSRVSIRVTDRV